MGFGVKTAITITLDNLITAANLGRISSLIDNSAGTYRAAEVTVKVVLGAGTPGDHKAVYVYIARGLDNALLSDNAPTSDQDWTPTDPDNLELIGVINAPTSGGTFTGVFRVHNLPPYWSLFVRNRSNIALAATGHSAEYVGVS